jgi:CotH kinase protein
MRWLVALLVAGTAAALAPAAPAAAKALPVVSIAPRGAITDERKVRARVKLPGYDGYGAVELRGQSSQSFAKKSYALELRTARDRDQDAPLLGMPADDDWVLYAAHNDKTLMRNVVAYDTARWIGRYASRTRWVELWLDGRYHGVYVLMEALELGGERIVGDQLYELTFTFQTRSNSTSFRTTRRPIVWADLERGDLSRRKAAAVDFAIVNELFKNQDAFHASTYMALAEKLVLGPVWDFDISSGNSNYGASRRLEGWMLDRRDWAERLYRDRSFRQAMAARWRELMARGLRARLRATVDEQVRAAIGRNFRRWPVLNRSVWPNPAVRGTYRAEVAHLRSWLDRRARWIDANIGR